MGLLNLTYIHCNLPKDTNSKVTFPPPPAQKSNGAIRREFIPATGGQRTESTQQGFDNPTRLLLYCYGLPNKDIVVISCYVLIIYHETWFQVEFMGI